MSPLYRLHTGGTLARHEADGLKLYEIGHEIELDADEAARLNEGRSLANSRVVKVGGEIETTTPKPARERPEVVQIEVASPGTPGSAELIAMGAEPAMIEAALIREQEEAQTEPLQPIVPPTPDPIVFTDEAPTPVAHIEEPVAALAAEAPIADDDVASDWPTYLAATSAAEVAETLRTLESIDDVQAAMDAESSPSGQRRPLVIRAGNAAIRRLRKTS